MAAGRIAAMLASRPPRPLTASHCLPRGLRIRVGDVRGGPEAGDDEARRDGSREEEARAEETLRHREKAGEAGQTRTAATASAAAASN